jgi:probable phosphoglycerate mutase
LPVQVREGLIEIDVGEWQGEKLGGLRRLKLWKVVQTRPSRMQFPGGEALIEAQNRICRQLDEIAACHEPKDVVVCVSHADPIRLAVAFYIGLPLDFFQRLAVGPASITTLQLQGPESRLIALNYEIPFTLQKT